MDRTRTQDLFNASQFDVTMIGAGGIGALTAITLGKMGFGAIFVFDDDIVDDVNVATQFYSQRDVGLRKTEALSANMAVFASDVPVHQLPYRLDELLYTPDTDIIISSVDSIRSRQGIWKSVSRNSFGLYIEARMNAESLQLYCINRRDDDTSDWYQNMIMRQNDDDFPDLPCTAKATFYTANLAAAYIGYLCRRFITHEPLRRVYTIDLPNMSVVLV